MNICNGDEKFVPLQCQRKKMKFAACLGDKNFLACGTVFPRQSQKWSRVGGK